MELPNIALVQKSLEKLLQEPDRAVSLFYNHLFTLDPALCSLFPADFTSHGRQFLNTLHLAACGLHIPQTVIPTIKEIGRRHAKIGVQTHHYHMFGEALFLTLANLQGEAFTEETSLAWTEFYYLLAGLMKEAAVSP